MTVGRGDTICIGKSVPLSASGASTYQWSPPLWLSNPNTANPVSIPDSTITYTVIGSDNVNCFKDTGTVKIKVYKIPTVDITNGANVNVIVGSSLHLTTTASSDVTSYTWTPPQGLSCGSCPDPTTTPKENATYTVNVRNGGNCTASDEVTITLLCNDGNVFIPNTFFAQWRWCQRCFLSKRKGAKCYQQFYGV